MEVRILFEHDIRALIGPQEALAAVRDAFARLARGEATLPGVIGLDLPAHQGEVHVKGAHLHGSSSFSVKMAAGFYANVARGLPFASGLVLVFSAETGFLRALLFDNAYLTELRTGAAGALAADLLAKRDVARVALLGYGSQARYQLEALLLVRRPREVVVWGPSEARAAAAARDMELRFGLPVLAVPTARDAASGSDLIITTTPAREPILRAEWVGPGTHVTAVGSDGPDKHELDVAVLSKADKVVADRLDQCLRLGEIHHAVAAGVLRAEEIHGELGELAAGLKRGRVSDDEITVADLTGVGIQDAAVADRVVASAFEKEIGQTLSVP
jgi:ectoine utilization protein EutC